MPQSFLDALKKTPTIWANTGVHNPVDEEGEQWMPQLRTDPTLCHRDGVAFQELLPGYHMDFLRVTNLLKPRILEMCQLSRHG